MSSTRIPVSKQYRLPFSSDDLSPYMRRQFTLLAALAILDLPSANQLREATGMKNTTFYRHLHALHDDFGIRTSSYTIEGAQHFRLVSWGVIDKDTFLRLFAHLAEN